MSYFPGVDNRVRRAEPTEIVIYNVVREVKNAGRLIEHILNDPVWPRSHTERMSHGLLK
ncbi:hypothetical protein PHLCEN_2v4377 [Hermanssonia centrifuga]|uniref:Uncharacterized protein n=1 Tax=Hermanssonia centrifuga TaxID=98765 RepID=A0A2R6PVD9_9APHY|nr:hypothetical protein PHLCEN_2v4377 [Hermanssonia centrifuga]